MAAVAGANPNYGIGDPGGSFVGIGAMTRACNVPNALQPTIPGGGLLGPDGYVPIWSNPGYDITPPVVSGALPGGFPLPWDGFDPTMPLPSPVQPPSPGEIISDWFGSRAEAQEREGNIQNLYLCSVSGGASTGVWSNNGAAEEEPDSSTSSTTGTSGSGSVGSGDGSSTGASSSGGSRWHLGQGNHGHTITSPEGYTLTTLRGGMEYGFEDSGQDRGTGLLAVDDYTGYDGDNPMIEIGPDANKGYEVTHQRTGLYAHTEVGSAISSDVELEEHFDRQIRKAKEEATIWMVAFIGGSFLTIGLGSVGAFAGLADTIEYHLFRRIAGHKTAKHLAGAMIERDISPASIGRAIRSGDCLYDTLSGAKVLYNKKIAVITSNGKIITTYPQHKIKSRWINWINHLLS